MGLADIQIPLSLIYKNNSEIRIDPCYMCREHGICGNNACIGLLDVFYKNSRSSSLIGKGQISNTCCIYVCVCAYIYVYIFKSNDIVMFFVLFEKVQPILERITLVGD